MSLKGLILILVSLISVAVFFYISHPSELYFLNDDNIYIPLSKNWNFLYGTSFRPISDMSLFIDYFLWDTNSFGYHLSNLFIHLATTLILYFFSKQFFKQYSNIQYRTTALAVCLLFLFYPFHSEPLYWIIGRGGLLATFFGVCSLYFYLIRGHYKWSLPLSILFFLIGAFSYETIWIVPLNIIVMTWFDFKYFGYPRKNSLRDVGLFWFFFIIYLVIRTSIIGELGGTPYGSAAALNFDLIQWVKKYNILIARSFLPPMKSTLIFIISYIFIFAILGAVFLRLYVKGTLTIALKLSGILFLISFLPVINFGVDSHDSESERFLYFPSVFAILLLTELTIKTIGSKFIRYSILGIMVIAEIILLSNAASTYQKSSHIAAVTMNAVSKTKSNQTLYCINLPTQYEGAFIYRIGFKEAVDWLTPDSASKKAVIISTREVYKPVLPYVYKETSITEWSMVLDNKEKIFFGNFLDTAKTKGFVMGRDVIFYWTDSVLLSMRN